MNMKNFLRTSSTPSKAEEQSADYASISSSVLSENKSSAPVTAPNSANIIQSFTPANRPKRQRHETKRYTDSLEDTFTCVEKKKILKAIRNRRRQKFNGESTDEDESDRSINSSEKEEEEHQQEGVVEEEEDEDDIPLSRTKHREQQCKPHNLKTTSCTSTTKKGRKSSSVGSAGSRGKKSNIFQEKRTKPALKSQKENSRLPEDDDEENDDVDEEEDDAEEEEEEPEEGEDGDEEMKKTPLPKRNSTGQFISKSVFRNHSGRFISKSALKACDVKVSTIITPVSRRTSDRRSKSTPKAREYQNLKKGGKHKNESLASKSNNNTAASPTPSHNLMISPEKTASNNRSAKSVASVAQPRPKSKRIPALRRGRMVAYTSSRHLNTPPKRKKKRPVLESSSSSESSEESSSEEESLKKRLTIEDCHRIESTKANAKSKLGRVLGHDVTVSSVLRKRRLGVVRGEGGGDVICPGAAGEQEDSRGNGGTNNGWGWTPVRYHHFWHERDYAPFTVLSSFNQEDETEAKKNELESVGTINKSFVGSRDDSATAETSERTNVDDGGIFTAEINSSARSNKNGKMLSKETCDNSNIARNSAESECTDGKSAVSKSLVNRNMEGLERHTSIDTDTEAPKQPLHQEYSTVACASDSSGGFANKIANILLNDAVMKDPPTCTTTDAEKNDHKDNSACLQSANDNTIPGIASNVGILPKQPYDRSSQPPHPLSIQREVTGPDTSAVCKKDFFAPSGLCIESAADKKICGTSTDTAACPNVLRKCRIHKIAMM